MRVWRILSRIATVAGIVGGLLFLLLLVVSLIAFIPGSARIGGLGQSIDHEPIRFEDAVRLIDRGEIYMVAIRKEGNTSEYFLLEESPNQYDLGAEPSRTWSVKGVDVHVFTESMPTGVPVTSRDESDEVGITSDELTDLLQRVDQFNAASSWQIQIIDHRD